MSFKLKKMTYRSLLVLIFLLCIIVMAGMVKAEEHSYLAFEDDFEDGDLTGWEQGDYSEWTI